MVVHAEVFERFAQGDTIPVIAQVAMEHALSPSVLDRLFEDVADRQYTRELLFSSIVELMSLVVCGIQPSVNAAYTKNALPISVSLKALYGKLARIETRVGAALVRLSAQRLGPVVAAMRGGLPPFLDGHHTKILDGNHLPGTEHRLKELRTTRAGALPGHALVVFDPALMMVVDAVLCEDGHAQERSLLDDVLEPSSCATSGLPTATSARPASSSASRDAAAPSSSASMGRRCFTRSSASERPGDGSRPAGSSSKRSGRRTRRASRRCFAGSRWSWTSRPGTATRNSTF